MVAHRRPPHTHHIPFTAPITPQGHCHCGADDATRGVIYETAKLATPSAKHRPKPKVKHIDIQTHIFNRSWAQFFAEMQSDELATSRTNQPPSWSRQQGPSYFE